MPKSNFKSPIEALENLKANRKALSKPRVEQPSPQMRLELWPEAVRGVPNAVLRGSLFSVSQRRSTAKKRTLLATVEGIEVRFKGERFNQVDLDVWEMLLHLARQQPLGDRVEFSTNAFLKELGRGTSGKHHEELKEEFARLLGGVVEVTWTEDKKTYIGHLLEKAYRDEATQRYVVLFDPKMLSLYESGYSYVDWEQRKALRNNSLAKWLHGFYSTHAAPFPYKVETIKSLCGSTIERLTDFRKALRPALECLVEIKAITDWEIDKADLVHVSKVPTLSQRKHLLKKGK